MKQVILFVIIALSAISVTPHVAAQAVNPVVAVCFTSGYGSKSNCASLIIYWIQRANSTIHILIYSFTLASITSALVAAKNRGVDVQIVMDHAQSKEASSQYPNLNQTGLQVRLSNNAFEMHDKLAVIDGHVVLTGSFNWTNDANSNNDENLLVLDNRTTAALYEQEFQLVWNAAA